MFLLKINIEVGPGQHSIRPTKRKKYEFVKHLTGFLFVVVVSVGIVVVIAVAGAIDKSLVVF